MDTIGRLLTQDTLNMYAVYRAELFEVCPENTQRLLCADFWHGYSSDVHAFRCPPTTIALAVFVVHLGTV